MRRLRWFLSAALVAAALVFVTGCDGHPGPPPEPTQPSATQTSIQTTTPTAPELNHDNLSTLLTPLIEVVEKCENGFYGLDVDPSNDYVITTPGCRSISEAKAYLSQFLSPAMMEKYVTADALIEKDGALYCRPPETDADRWQLVYHVSGAKIVSKQDGVYEVEIPLFRKHNGSFVSTDLLRVQYVGDSFQLLDIVYGAIAP